MKECSGKKVQKVKVAQNDPHWLIQPKKLDSKIKDVGYSYMFKKKFIKNLQYTLYYF